MLNGISYLKYCTDPWSACIKEPVIKPGIQLCRYLFRNIEWQGTCRKAHYLDGIRNKLSAARGFPFRFYRSCNPDNRLT